MKSRKENTYNIYEYVVLVASVVYGLVLKKGFYMFGNSLNASDNDDDYVKCKNSLSH